MLQRFLLSSPFWWLLAAVFVFVIGSHLLLDGYFMDGTLYSVMARNMSEGLSSYSAPMVSETWLPRFHHSLQLGIILESFFFSLLGDHAWVEKLYSFFMCILQLVMIVKIWRLLFSNDDDAKRLAWFPALLWVTVPIVFWVFTNNMLEMTTSFFALLAVWLTLKGMQVERKGLWFLVAGTAVFLTVMSKSLMGAFPLAFLGLHWLTVRQFSFSKTLLNSFIVLGGFALALGAMLLYEPMREALSEHWNTMLAPSFEGKAGVVRSRFLVMKRVFLELIPMLGLTSLFLLIMTRELRKQIKWKWVVFFVLLAISASAPIMLSQKQAGYYAMPSYPYFAFAVAFICLPALKEWLGRINPNGMGWKVFRVLCMFALVAGLVFTFVRPDRYQRHEALFVAIEEFRPHVQEQGMIIATCPLMRKDFHVSANFYRKLHVSFDIENEHPFYLGNRNCSPGENYEQVAASGEFVLYKRN